MMSTLRNFHVPLSEELYRQLRAQADKVKRPAVELARTAIESFLRELERQKLLGDILNYAAANAGGSGDLDEELEGAAIEFLFGEEQ